MRAWTVDADDIRVAEDFDEALLHRTPEIDNFLSLDRDDKFIVIGTKGFGKTLLLKAKRILYQRRGGTACLPAGNLLDKLIGDKIFGKGGPRFLCVVLASVGQSVAHGNRGGRPQTSPPDRGAQGQPEAGAVDHRRTAARCHRSLRPAPGFSTERPPTQCR